jgi:hypothetical protein
MLQGHEESASARFPWACRSRKIQRTDKSKIKFAKIGRRSAACQAKLETGKRERRPILDVHDVKQPDARMASFVTQFRARR